MFLRFNKFYSPDDNSGIADVPDNSGGAPASDDKDDVIEFLGEDEPDETLDLTERKPKAKATADDEPADDGDEESPDDTGDKEDDDDELVSLVDETEPPTEEQLELMTPVRRREILKKYPQLFKDFPYLERAYYREQQFTELLPTVEDAKEAVAKSATLDRFETDLMGGNVETILQAVKDQSPNSFYNIVDNLMPTLAKVDEKAYHHILGNTIKHTIIAMVREGRAKNDEVLQSAAQILNQFVFGSTEFKNPAKLATDTPKESKPNGLEQKEQEFTRRQFETARDTLNTRVNNTLKSTIDAHIDPKGSMTDYVKRNAVREVSETLRELISKDKRFSTIIDKLWEDAFKKNFSKDSTDRIRSAYLSKSKTLLPSVIKKARIEALRGMGKRVRDEQPDEQPDNKGQKTQSKPRSNDSGKSSKAGSVPKGVSTLDFLMQD